MLFGRLVILLGVAAELLSALSGNILNNNKNPKTKNKGYGAVAKVKDDPHSVARFHIHVI
jgi:hypothetical protein